MILLNNAEHAEAISKEVGLFFNPACDHIISREKAGRLLGGVIFTGFTGSSIALHAASFDTRWLNKDMLALVFDYPFNQLKVRKLIAQVPSGNRKALDFNRKLGFIEEARISDIYPDGDLVILSMQRDQCRWLIRGPCG